MMSQHAEQASWAASVSSPRFENSNDITVRNGTIWTPGCLATELGCPSWADPAHDEHMALVARRNFRDWELNTPGTTAHF